MIWFSFLPEDLSCFITEGKVNSKVHQNVPQDDRFEVVTGPKYRSRINLKAVEFIGN